MVFRLSMDKLRRARNYLMKDGRMLDRELYKYYFEDGTSDTVILELSKYQGEHGGFQNLGEGERNKENVMDTNLAFQILNSINARSNEPIVQKGIEYIVNSFDCELTYWHPNSSFLPTDSIMLNDKWGNPCAELLAYLYDYKELVSPNFLSGITELAMNKLEYLNKEGWFATLCYLRLAERLEEPKRTKIIDKIKSIIWGIVETRQEVWTNHYCAKPYWYAPSPHSP